MGLSEQEFQASNPLTLAQLADGLGVAFKIEGEPNTLIESVSALGFGSSASLCYSILPREESLSLFLNSQCRTLVWESNPESFEGRTVIQVSDARGWFIDAIALLKPERATNSMEAGRDGIHPTAIVDSSAVVERGAIVGPGCIVAPHAYISAASCIGENVRIGPGSIVGCEGLSPHHRPNGELIAFPHLGTVRIGDNTRVGAQVTIVRGVLADTIIGSSVDIGNQVNVGHNVKLGDKCFVSSGSVITGNCVLGDGVRLGAGTVIAPHTKVGDQAHIGLGSVVVRDVSSFSKVLGVPARNVPYMAAF